MPPSFRLPTQGSLTALLEDRVGGVRLTVLFQNRRHRLVELSDSSGRLLLRAAITWVARGSAVRRLITELSRSGLPTGTFLLRKDYRLKRNIIELKEFPLPVSLRRRFRTTVRSAPLSTSEFFVKRTGGANFQRLALLTELLSPSFSRGRRSLRPRAATTVSAATLARHRKVVSRLLTTGRSAVHLS